MARQFFKDLPDTSTPLTASRLNGLLDGEEAMGNLVVDSIRSKNIFVGIIEQGSFLPSTGEPVSGTTRIRSASFTNVKAGNYTISLYNNNNFDVVVYVYDIDGTWKSSESITDWQSIPYTINIQGERKIKIAIRNKNNSTIVPSDVQNVQIEEGTTASTFSPYFSPANEMSDKLSQIAFKTTNTQFTIKQYSGINLNNLADQLGVSFIYGTSLTNAPVGALGYIITICILEPAYAKQYFMAPWSGSPEIYTRTKDNGTWSSWYKINVVAL